MYKKFFLEYQFKNNRLVLLIYCILYILLLLLAVGIRFGNATTDLWDKFWGCIEPVRLCIAVTTPFVMSFLSAEIIACNKHPHLIIYRYKWNWVDNLVNHVISMIFPIGLLCCVNLLYGDVCQIPPLVKGDLIINLVEQLVIVFVLASLSFCIGMLSKNVMLSVLVSLVYILVMRYMNLEERWFNLFNIEAYFADDWLLRTVIWAAVGIIINGTGVRVAKRTMIK